MNRNSLRWRVTSFYVGMLAVALLVFSAGVYVGIQTFLMRSLKAALGTGASTILTDYVRPLDSKGMTWFQSEMSESYPPGMSDSFVRVSRNGHILYQAGEAHGRRLSYPLPSLADHGGHLYLAHKSTRSDSPTIMLYALGYEGAQGDYFTIENGASYEPIQQMLRSLLIFLLIGTPAIMIAAAGGGYALMTRPLRPVVELTEKAEVVGRHDLGERLPILKSDDELERLSLALNRMIERLEETVAHNRRFSADASHELRTPLTIIRGEIESILQSQTLSAAVAEGLGSALEESDRMYHLIENLMTISRLEDGAESIKMVPLDLTSLARSTRDHLSLLAEEKSIELTCEFGPAVYIVGDPLRMTQVIVNLLDNSIKYTASGGSVRLSVKAEDDMAVLTVADTGIGVPASCLPFIFDRFYRADQARSRESGGMGLGLSIVKSICSAHGGSISASSVEGAGTTVTVKMPPLRDGCDPGKGQV